MYSSRRRRCVVHAVLDGSSGCTKSVIKFDMCPLFCEGLFLIIQTTRYDIPDTTCTGYLLVAMRILHILYHAPRCTLNSTTYFSMSPTSYQRFMGSHRSRVRPGLSIPESGNQRNLLLLVACPLGGLAAVKKYLHAW